MSEAVEDPFALAGTTLEKRFAVDRAVARGGFGVVYQGRHLTLKKPVAIKVLMMPSGLGIEEKRVFLQSFEQEAQTIAALEHPAIVRAYDFGIARPPGRRELPWLALEWIDGESLERRIEARAGAPMSPREVMSLLRPVLEGIAFAHSHHVAHRDLKPANIMLSTSGEAGVPVARLLDFGIAKVMNPDEAVGSGSTRTMAVFSAFSTPYASPEQKTGRKSGPWTDVHAMGLIITELLTGKAPYPGEDAVAVEMAILSPQRPTPARFGVDVGAWEPVLAKAVALNPPDRYPDAGALLAALEAALAEPQPVVASQLAAPPPPAPALQPTAFAPAMPPPPEYAPAPPPSFATPPPGYGQAPQGFTTAPPQQQGFAPMPPPPAYGTAQPPFAAPQPGYAPAPPGYGQYAQPGYAAPSFGQPAPPSGTSRNAIIAAALVGFILLSCVLCVAFAPEKKDGEPSPAQGVPSQPTMTPIPSQR